MLHNVSDGWLNDHGIDREVVDAHGLGEYRKDNVQAVQAAYRTLLQPAQRATMTRWARQKNGLLIPHHPVPGMGLPPIFPQIRPIAESEDDDGKIETGQARRHKPHPNVRLWAHHIARHP
jgi:hypothetical protein